MGEEAKASCCRIICVIIQDLLADTVCLVFFDRVGLLFLGLLCVLVVMFAVVFVLFFIVFIYVVWFYCVRKFMYCCEACLCVGIIFIICNKRPTDSVIYGWFQVKGMPLCWY